MRKSVKILITRYHVDLGYNPNFDRLSKRVMITAPLMILAAALSAAFVSLWVAATIITLAVLLVAGMVVAEKVSLVRAARKITKEES